MRDATGPALAEALASATGRPARAVRLVTNPMQIGTPLEYEPAGEIVDGTTRALLTVCGDVYWLRVEGESGPLLASGRGPDAVAARADALRRDDEARARVRAALGADEWPEGPPDSPGLYVVWLYADNATPDDPDDGYNFIHWSGEPDETWPARWEKDEAGAWLPARYQRLTLPAPPERG